MWRSQRILHNQILNLIYYNLPLDTGKEHDLLSLSTRYKSSYTGDGNEDWE